MPGEKAVGTEQLLPYEKGADSPADVHKGLLAALDSETSEQPEANESETDEGDEPDEVSEEDDEPSEDESDEGEEDEGDENEGPDEDPLYETIVDGQTQKITLKEALAGYQRQQDYTRGKQTLARETETTQAEAKQLRERRDVYAQNLEALALTLKDLQPKEPDWDALRKENATEYAVQRADFQRMKDRQAEVEAEQRRVFEERKTAWEKEQDAFLKTETDKLHEAIPAWKDQKVAEAEKGKLVEYLTGPGGWTLDDVANVADHRLMVALRKAMLYDEGQTKGKDKLRDKVKPVSVMKPGAQARSQKAGPKSVRRAAERLKRTGRAEDAAALFEQFLPD